MHSKDSEFWIEAMKTEVLDLLSRNTWERIPRSSILLDAKGKKIKVLKSIRAFKLKRFSDGTPQKFKAEILYWLYHHVSEISFTLGVQITNTNCP